MLLCDEEDVADGVGLVLGGGSCCEAVAGRTSDLDSSVETAPDPDS